MKNLENKKAFTLSCKTFSSDSSQAKLTQPPAQSSCFLPFNGHAPSEPETSALRQKSASQTKFRSRAAHSYGFTLAETLIVLVILGVVAAITIPALVNRHVEAERRTKLKKAMSVYDMALNKMVIENGIKSNTALSDWAEEDCSNTSAYFKSAQNLEEDGNETLCKFRASDGVFWDISDIKRPIVALREQDLNEETANSNTNRAFYMFGWIDEQGSLRVDDLGKITGDDKVALIKLYDFINGKTTTSNAEIPEIKYSKPCPNECDVIAALQGSSSGCSSCTAIIDGTTTIFDNNEKLYKAIQIEDLSNDYSKLDYRVMTINSDLSMSEKVYYKSGALAVEGTHTDFLKGSSWNWGWSRSGDDDIGELHINADYGDNASQGSATAYYENGSILYTLTQNNAEEYCEKRFNADGSVLYSVGSLCED